eukprot:2274873-Pyramimonas_sp.AAC.1
MQWPPRGPKSRADPVGETLRAGGWMGGPPRKLQKPDQDSTWYSAMPQQTKGHGGGLMVSATPWTRTGLPLNGGGSRM